MTNNSAPLPALPSGNRRWTGILLLAIAVLGFFQFSHLSPIHGWSDDGSVYLQYARNLLEGRPYHYVQSGQALSITSPPTRYPPLAPLLLAPIVYWRGLDFWACKLLMLVLFLAALVVSAFALRPHFPPPVVLATALCCVGSFTLWRNAEHINSDYTFLVFVGLLFIASEQWTPRTTSPLVRPIVCALLIVLATATRTVGLFVLLPSFLLATFWRYRRFSKEAWLTCLFAASASLALRNVLGGEAYGGQLSSLLNWATLRRNLIQYPLAITELTGGGFAVAALLDVLFFAGAVLSLRKGPQLWAAFALAYGGVLVFWPFSDPVRFLIPLWPWIIACLFYAIYLLLASTGKAAWVIYILTGTFLALQIPQYNAASALPHPVGLNDPEIQSIYDFARHKLPADSVTAFRKPRSFSLLTGLRSIQYGTVPSNRMGADLCRSGTTHVLVAPAIFESDATYLSPWVAEQRTRLEELFRTPNFTLYRIPSKTCTLFTAAP